MLLNVFVCVCLSQDLPNNMIHQVAIFSLPQEWLWCETWCSDDDKAYAKTIDLVCISHLMFNLMFLFCSAAGFVYMVCYTKPALSRFSNALKIIALSFILCSAHSHAR